MTSLVSRVLSQTEKLPVIGNASTWYSGKKEEVWSNPNSRRTSLEDSGCYNDLYRLTPPGSPRYSMAAPPPYEKVVEPENRGLTNRITTILKRASFSSAANTDVKEPVIAPTANIDKKEIEHAMTLINVATDMNHSGNQQMATDLYMMGIDKLMSALPLDSDSNVKGSLERKLVELKERHKLNLISLNDLIPENLEQGDDSEEGKSLRSQVSNLVINAAVMSAVALKKSPIPDAVASTVNYVMDSAQSMDKNLQIRKRTWDLTASGVSKVVEIDRRFEIHQMLTGAVYTGFTAFVKAGVAYAETPSSSVPQ